ncbi:hypothetical protein C8Q73DRAFT_667262 [Cubamyces lactineus]|nr:hypothetical protein C8Q73DRAFT_667262 [Cubamyces lactineus]
MLQAFMTNGSPAAPHVIPHGMAVDPAVLLSMLATLAAGSQSSTIPTQPVPDNSRNDVGTTKGSDNSHLAWSAPRAQAHSTVPWDYTGGGDSNVNLPAVVDPRLLQPETAQLPPVSDGAQELLRLSPAGKAALVELIDHRIQVAFKKRGLPEEPAAAPATKKKRQVIQDAREVPANIRHAVWTNTHFLLGTGDEATITQTGKPSHFELPLPLKPEDPIRFARDGTRLYNPIWTLPIDKGINDLFLSAVVKLTMSNGGAPPFNLSPEEVSDKALITLAAKSYMKSLKRSFMLQGKSGTEQRAKKQIADKYHGRRARKYDYLVKAIPAFRKVFGHAKTVGIEDVVQVGWMSDEHSAGEGEEDPEREERRHKAGVGPSAWELCSPLWRSRKLYIIYFVLAIFRRFMRDRKVTLKNKDRAAQTTSVSAGDGEDNEHSSDLSDGARETFLDRMGSAVRAWRTVLVHKGRHYERFRGPEDVCESLPRDGVQDGIYRECLSRTWASTDPEHQAYYDHARSCPEDFTIFDLEIPLTLLPEDDKGWLADSEDEGAGDD